MDEILLKILQDGSTTVPNLLMDNFKKLGMSNDEFLLYLQIKKEQGRGNFFPEMDALANYIGTDIQNLYSLLQSLQQKKIMSISQRKNERGQQTDFYDFKLLDQKLIALLKGDQVKLKEEKNKAVSQVKQDDKEAIFDQIQLEFNRPLSPLEIESINAWMEDDHYSPELIRAALKEATLNQAYSLKYMDRILLSWEKRNIKTAQQVEAYVRDVRKGERKQVNSNEKPKKAVQIPIFRFGEDGSIK
ncbi:DnaD domain-containing protein [Pediococcus claussenii]|uniref:DNA replication protein DnaD n=1 Tax=Pediococcus claussenii (strain ATCC BAA-344 / DSM 14800 / JCM 18046 / KCTC 3811 / LMG 21948 / P06) TaxID=701521 RepID=G8PDF1_PEDCP|nr:DnaD domain protein [Pediococcus claussenii]AEV95286.1 DNA replication protein DnaD [Pediococcus claussenii ATCC BAA-344]ANZ68821.1 DNA replication protein DnaD [Pediococcus claussenii]ANZ70637.1 DNA replication protein DnaD [Pediococcus claussenii]